MIKDNRKVAIIGTGTVGMSCAYALLNQNACDEMILVDINKDRAAGEAMDLNHGLAFSSSHMKIRSGNYSDCGGADIIIISAGVAQKPGESRLNLLKRNAEVFKSIVIPTVQAGFGGIFLVATNPVDIMAQVTRKLSGFEAQKVFGTGTALDTARLRYMLGKYFNVDPRNMHAYVMGEHGDSEFVPWSQAMLATKPVLQLCENSNGRYSISDLNKIQEDVKNAAQKIIAAKGATYYGIGMALVRIIKAIFGDENSVLTVSANLSGEYGVSGVYAGVPCTVNRNGIGEILRLSITEDETERFKASCSTLSEHFGLLSV